MPERTADLVSGHVPYPPRQPIALCLLLCKGPGRPGHQQPEALSDQVPILFRPHRNETPASSTIFSSHRRHMMTPVTTVRARLGPNLELFHARGKPPAQIGFIQHVLFRLPGTCPTCCHTLLVMFSASGGAGKGQRLDVRDHSLTLGVICHFELRWSRGSGIDRKRLRKHVKLNKDTFCTTSALGGRGGGGTALGYEVRGVHTHGTLVPVEPTSVKAT